MESDIFYLQSNQTEVQAIINEITTHGGQVEYISPILPIIAYKSKTDISQKINESFDTKTLVGIPNGRVQEDLIGSLNQFTPLQIIPRVDYASLRQSGCAGWGKTIAILDAGISEEWVKDHYDFTGFGSDPFIQHGNKVANIIKRFCRGANLINCKVTQEADTVRGIDVLSGIDFAVNTLKANIINLSLGFQVPKCDGNSCAICQTVNAYAKRDNVLFIVAAGNEYIENTICCPGKAGESVTVGATGQTFQDVAAYSSKGVEGIIKPNILTSGSIIYNGVPESGTSFAAPVITGVSAAILSRESQMGSVEMKNLLYANATDINHPKHHQGFGVMNLEKMLEVLANASGNSQSSGQGES